MIKKLPAPDELPRHNASQVKNICREVVHQVHQLAALQQPDAAEKVQALFAAKGKLTQRPKAGASF
jgi:hypothetical protein